MASLSTLVRGLALGAALAMASTAAVADPATYNWSGLYAGWTYGWAGTDFKGSYVTSATSNHHDASGNSQFRSGFIGLQHQWGQFVLGIETNYGGTGWSDDWDARNDGPSASCLQGAAIAKVSCRARMDSLFQVGPRLGYAPTNQWLVFATGGYASGRVDTSVQNLITNTEIGRSNVRHNGWYAGAGVEYAYTPNWIIGLEYQRISLDTERHYDSLWGPSGVVNAETRDMSGDANVVRLRTTFKLNRPEPAPEPMK